MKVYTKTGDKGLTSLIGGERVAKCDCRVEAYGTVDELSAFVALLADTLRDAEGPEGVVGELHTILSRMMTVEALLACGEEWDAQGGGKVAPLPEEAVTWLEERIDAMQAALPALTKFTIPGGHRAVSLAHVCRTVCRRAERMAIRADQQHPVDPAVLRWLNRLSDYFYLVGRTLTLHFGVEEIAWIP